MCKEIDVICFFPKWNPQKTTLNKINGGLNRKLSFKLFRSSSSGFIKKADVRNKIMIECNNICVYCGSEKNLQVDHIVSVKSCFDKNLIFFCNTKANLQILCKKCNTSKNP